jgi:hypothetical protein
MPVSIAAARDNLTSFSRRERVFVRVFGKIPLIQENPS